MVEAMNCVKGINAQFIEHLDQLQESWEGLCKLLGRYLKLMQAGFTGNYMFEFHNWNVIIKHLFSDKDDGITVSLYTHHEIIENVIWFDCFRTNKKDIDVGDMRLPWIPNIDLNYSKVKLISKKFEVIPKEHWWYYPDPMDNAESNSNCSQDKDSSASQVLKTESKKGGEKLAGRRQELSQKSKVAQKNHHAW